MKVWVVWECKHLANLFSRCHGDEANGGTEGRAREAVNDGWVFANESLKSLKLLGRKSTDEEGEIRERDKLAS